jgi:16S rRNA (uracil1498-N3)-methyltransferase
MTAPVFVLAAERLAGCVAGDAVTVQGPEGRHGATVRRLRPGETVDVVDGFGRRASGVVAAVPGPDRFDVAIATVTDEPEPAPRITVVLALLKGDRMESAVEMLTEIGADEIVPWEAERCVVRWRPDRRAKAQARLAAAVHAAGKQSRRARFPVLAPPSDSHAVAHRLAAADLGLVLHEGAGEAMTAAALPGVGEVVIVLGPEGGITPEEVDLLERSGGRAVRLGGSVLRAGTAAAAACAVAMGSTGRWS